MDPSSCANTFITRVPRLRLFWDKQALVMQARNCSSSSSVLCSFAVSQVIPYGSQPVSFCSFSDFWGQFCGHMDEYFIQLFASTVLTIFAVLGMISTSYLFVYLVSIPKTKGILSLVQSSHLLKEGRRISFVLHATPSTCLHVNFQLENLCVKKCF